MIKKKKKIAWNQKVAALSFCLKLEERESGQVQHRGHKSGARKHTFLLFSQPPTHECDNLGFKLDLDFATDSSGHWQQLNSWGVVRECAQAGLVFNTIAQSATSWAVSWKHLSQFKESAAVEKCYFFICSLPSVTKKEKRPKPRNSMSFYDPDRGHPGAGSHLTCFSLIKSFGQIFSSCRKFCICP